MIILGIVLGITGKISDAYTEHLSNILSGVSFWIMLCTLIAVASSSPRRAAAYVFGMCAAMVASYYVTAELAVLYYSMTFAYGWTVFALCSPLFGFAAWYARGHGAISKVLALGILAAMLVGTYMLFKIRIYDIIFIIITAIILLKPKKS